MSATAFQRRRRKLAKQESLSSHARGFGVPIDTVHYRSLVEYTVSELKAICKERGLTGYSKKNEAELIQMLLGGE